MKAGDAIMVAAKKQAEGEVAVHLANAIDGDRTAIGFNQSQEAFQQN